MLIKVRFPLGYREGYQHREYTYEAPDDLELRVTDLVNVQTQDGEKTVLVSEVDVSILDVPEHVRALIKPIVGKVAHV